MWDRSRPPVMIDILEEHFEELDFLWEQREGVIFAPDWNLKELAELEESAEAHLDGLRIGAEDSVEVARPGLAREERGAATAAALTLMATGQPELESEVVRALTVHVAEIRDGIRIGLRHSNIERVLDDLAQLASSGEPLVRAAAADVLAFQRRPPPPRFVELLNHPDPEVRRLAYGAAGRFGGPWSVDNLHDTLLRDSSAVQRTALETSARIGMPNLDAICRKAATRPQDPSTEALVFLGVLGDPRDLAVLQTALGEPGLAVAALVGIGALGRVAVMPFLIQAMQNPLLTRAAGAAFVRITGATDVEADLPLPPPTNLPENEVDFRDDTRTPDAGRAQAWWEQAKGRFSPEGRWQAGLEVSKAPLGEQFDGLPLQSRRDVYLGVRVRDPVRTADLELERRAALQAART